MAEEKKKAKLMPEGKEYTVSGYTFRTKEAAQEAKTELAAIKYMSSKTDSKDSKQVYILYNSIIDKELFRTPVGMNYLKELQQFLYMADDVPNDKIRPIPINHETKELMDGRREIIENKGVIRRLTDDRNRYKDWFIKSIIVNIVLIIVIAAVIAITANSKNPNVLNYEVNLQDKYSSWQEQLESQEASLKAREQQLNSR